MDFGNKNLWLLFEWNGTSIYVTQTLLATWVVMAVLLVIAVVIRLRLSSFKDVPKGLQNGIEALVEIMENFTKSTMGEGYEGYGGFFFGIFAFILLSNYSGLVGLRPPTSDLATTAALAITSFLLIHLTGLRKLKGGYFKSYLSPLPLLLPLNIMGELSKPISLCFRLFGNVLGGFIILSLVYEMLPFALRFVLPDVLHLFFDILVGALQAFIFTVLSMTFIQQKSVRN